MADVLQRSAAPGRGTGSGSGPPRSAPRLVTRPGTRHTAHGACPLHRAWEVSSRRLACQRAGQKSPSGKDGAAPLQPSPDAARCGRRGGVAGAGRGAGYCDGRSVPLAGYGYRTVVTETWTDASARFNERAAALCVRQRHCGYDSRMKAVDRAPTGLQLLCMDPDSLCAHRSSCRRRRDPSGRPRQPAAATSAINTVSARSANVNRGAAARPAAVRRRRRHRVRRPDTVRCDVTEPRLTSPGVAPPAEWPLLLGLGRAVFRGAGRVPGGVFRGVGRVPGGGGPCSG